MKNYIALLHTNTNIFHFDTVIADTEHEALYKTILNAFEVNGSVCINSAMNDALEDRVTVHESTESLLDTVPVEVDARIDNLLNSLGRRCGQEFTRSFVNTLEQYPEIIERLKNH